MLRVEIAGTVSRLSGDAGKGESFSQAIFALPYIRWISLDDTMAARSAEIAARHYLRGADAVYAAVAVEYNCVLVSLDNEHLKRLNDAVQVLTPEQALFKISK